MLEQIIRFALGLQAKVEPRETHANKIGPSSESLRIHVFIRLVLLYIYILLYIFVRRFGGHSGYFKILGQ